MAWTTEDTASMDKAADEAIAEFEKMMAEGRDSVKELVDWYNRWFMKAGHKRLGRYLVALAKRTGAK